MSFKTYHAQASYATKESKFEETLCRHLIQMIPEIDSEPGSSSAEKVEQYLISKPDDFEKVLMRVYKYIKSEKITHYISGIDLGAAVYSISTSKNRLKCRLFQAEVGMEYLAGLGGGVEFQQEKKHHQRKKHVIGNLLNLRRGKGEGVIGYSILPLFTLVCDEHREIKRVLRLATCFYLDKSRKENTSLGLVW